MSSNIPTIAVKVSAILLCVTICAALWFHVVLSQLDHMSTWALIGAPSGVAALETLKYALSERPPDGPVSDSGRLPCSETLYLWVGGVPSYLFLRQVTPSHTVAAKCTANENDLFIENANLSISPATVGL